MPYKKRKQKCKQADGTPGSYVLSYTDKKGKKRRACHTSKKKMQGQIAAIEAESKVVKITEFTIRKIIREELLQEVGPGVGMDPTAATMPRGMKRSEYNQLEAADPETFRIVMSIIDPTGALSIPDLPPALDAFEKNKTLTNALFLVLAVVAVVPVVGTTATVAQRLVTATKSAKNIISRSPKIKASAPENFWKSLDDAIDKAHEIQKILNAGPTAGRRVPVPDRPATPGMRPRGGRPVGPNQFKTGTGEVVDAKPGAPRGQGPQRGRSDPRMNPVQKIQSATKQASQSLPGEKVSLALAKKPKPHPPAVPKMLPKNISDEIYLRLSQGVRSLIEAALSSKSGVRVVSHGGSRGIGIKIRDALDDNAFKVLYDDTVERFPDAKSLWPDQDSFKSFVGEVDVQFFDKSASARAKMQSGDEGFRLRMNSGAEIDRLTSLIQRQGAQHGDSFTGDIPDWVYKSLDDTDFTHEFTHHIDKLTGILRAGRSQSAGKLGYSSWVHEINARYIAAIEEVERRLIAGDTKLISLLRDSDPLFFANVFMDIVDAKRSGGSYEGISALPPEVIAEMIDQILRPGGAYSILKQAIPEGTIREGSFMKITESKIRRVIREELAKMSPYKNYEYGVDQISSLSPGQEDIIGHT